MAAGARLSVFLGRLPLPKRVAAAALVGFVLLCGARSPRLAGVSRTVVVRLGNMEGLKPLVLASKSPSGCRLSE